MKNTKNPLLTPRSFWRNNLKQLAFVIALVMFANSGHSQNKLFSKLVSKIAKKAGGANTVSTATLNDLLPTVGIGSNLYPIELGTISQSFFGGWKTGGDQVFIMFTKKNEPGFYKIDGTVTLDGSPMEYTTAGLYSFISAANASPRKIEITTSTGQKSNFTIAPASKPIKVISINGQKDNVSLDLTKDVIIELEGAANLGNALLKVSLAINQLSIKSIYDVCFIHSGSTLSIPSAAFRNIGITPGGNGVYNYKNSFLAVELSSVENATATSGSFPSVQYTSSFSDGKFVTVKVEPNLNIGLQVKATDKNMDYQFFKPNAFLSRPFGLLKKIGAMSFSIRGTTFHESVETSTSTSTINIGNTQQTTSNTKTTITTLEFPQQPNEVWDALLEKLYPQFMAVVESEFNASIIPVDKITQSDAYKFTTAFAKDDANTKVAFARSFRNTKVLSAFMPMGDGFGTNGVNQRIMRETDADALITLTIDLEISEGADESILMIPKFAFEIVGKANGEITNTKYCSGTIKSSTGVAIKKDITMQQLEAIVREADLLTVFRKGLQELKAKEKANGDYETVWALQKN